MAMLDTLTFTCDNHVCTRSVTFYGSTDETDAHLWLVTDEGWGVGIDARILDTRRTHFCPEHKGQAK